MEIIYDKSVKKGLKPKRGRPKASDLHKKKEEDLSFLEKKILNISKIRKKAEEDQLRHSSAAKKLNPEIKADEGKYEADKGIHEKTISDAVRHRQRAIKKVNADIDKDAFTLKDVQSGACSTEEYLNDKEERRKKKIQKLDEINRHYEEIMKEIRQEDFVLEQKKDAIEKKKEVVRWHLVQIKTGVKMILEEEIEIIDQEIHQIYEAGDNQKILQDAQGRKERIEQAQVDEIIYARRFDGLSLDQAQALTFRCWFPQKYINDFRLQLSEFEKARIKKDFTVILKAEKPWSEASVEVLHGGYPYLSFKTPIEQGMITTQTMEPIRPKSAAITKPLRNAVNSEPDEVKEGPTVMEIDPNTMKRIRK